MVQLGFSYLELSKEVIPYIKDLNVRYSYNMLRWCNIQPKSRDQFIWSTYDAEFEQESSVGITSIRAITHTPNWAARPSDDYGLQTSPPRDISDWTHFIEALVKRYPGRTWTVWAEPDNYPPREAPELVCFTGTADDYAEMLKSAYTTAKKHDPECRVGIGGLVGATINGSSPYLVFDFQCEDRLIFLERLVELDCMKFCDFVGLDSYAYRYGGIQNVRNGISRIRKITRRKEMWILESGCKIRPVTHGKYEDFARTFGHEPVTQETNAGLLLSMYKICEEFDIPYLFWLKLHCSTWGLVNRLGKKHLSYYMFKLLSRPNLPQSDCNTP